VEALGLISDLDWTCTIAGSLERDPDAGEALKQQVVDLGLQDRIAVVGEVSEAEAAGLYAWADIFTLASVYEGYGMVFSEALAFGLPIVATTGGAIPEVVSPQTGILVAPGDAKGFAQALREIISDAVGRAALAEGSREAGARLTGWNQTAATIAERLDRL
jgi:glycosyltransferase involved in cell wall biosynthesis